MPRSKRRYQCDCAGMPRYDYMDTYYNSTTMYTPVFQNEFAGNYAAATVMAPMMAADPMPSKDFGPAPYVTNIEADTVQNNTFRTAIWTGKHLQVTLMSIGVGEDIGLEIHPNLDQFLRIEQGQGVTMMGSNRNYLDYRRDVKDGYAVMVPANTWHNLVNTGNVPLKLYSIYAPPQHPRGTVHRTKEEAMAAEASHG